MKYPFWVTEYSLSLADAVADKAMLLQSTVAAKRVTLNRMAGILMAFPCGLKLLSPAQNHFPYHYSRLSGKFRS
jgi:hypothetical protein